jgi:DNA-binding LytR/AlgR family response regulator
MKENIRILIVEDDMITAADIALQLKKLGYEVIGIAARAKEALAYMENQPPDLLIVDILLKGSMDGIELSAAIRQELDLPIIFLTANADEPTFERAKAVKPIAFISKPFKKLDLRHAVALAADQIRESQEEQDDMGQGNEPSFILEDRIFIKEKDRLVKILLEEILYIEAQRSYSRIFTTDKEFFLSIPLGKLLEKIEADFLIRVHRSFIINLSKIDAIEDKQVFIGTKAIPLSQSYREDFLNRIKKL